MNGAGSDLVPPSSGWCGDWRRLQVELGRRRRRQGVSQGAAGALIGVPTSTIKRYQCGGKDLRSSDLTAYAAPLDLRPACRWPRSRPRSSVRWRRWPPAAPARPGGWRCSGRTSRPWRPGFPKVPDVTLPRDQHRSHGAPRPMSRPSSCRRPGPKVRQPP
ncbi:MAG: helix-turn-helix domain-containing protein [Azospirillum sp.]|nr:helix-turn-helix domain-containing protein [Azospirillum sp.]